MKFGRALRDRTLKEWRYYTVDYKALKKSLKLNMEKDADKTVLSAVESDSENEDPSPDNFSQHEFFKLLEHQETKLSKFYAEKEKWAFDYYKTLEDRVEALREAAETPEASTMGPASSTSSLSGSGSFDNEKSSPVVLDLQGDLDKVTSKSNELLKDQYRKMGASAHFQTYIYAKKSLMTFQRELELLIEFLDLNKTAFRKILKKFDKKTGSFIMETKMEELCQNHKYLDGSILAELKLKVSDQLNHVTALKPRLPPGWENRKVYTIGCFDLFHRGHQNVLISLREFGYYIVAGIHDDESYFKLKKKYTIDNLETRMQNVKPYVDQLYVIPSTDPLLFIQSVVSKQDIESGACCYARGDDMLNFPARPWVESVMPVHFVPRTEACSSTLIRTIYHAPDESLRQKAAFAKTRYDGKPIDEEGNVLNLKVAA